jgi:uncharacterized membrane protein YkoI
VKHPAGSPSAGEKEMFAKFNRAAVVLIASASAVGAIAAEKQISRSQLPKAVRNTADEQSRGATIRKYTTEVENGQREYEVEMVFEGHSKDVTIAPDGRILEIEEQADINALPAQVVSALRRKAGHGGIVKVELVTKNGTVVAYEAQVRTAGKHSEIQVGPNGEDLKHEE